MSTEHHAGCRRPGHVVIRTISVVACLSLCGCQAAALSVGMLVLTGPDKGIGISEGIGNLVKLHNPIGTCQVPGAPPIGGALNGVVDETLTATPTVP